MSSKNGFFFLFNAIGAFLFCSRQGGLKARCRPHNNIKYLSNLNELLFLLNWNEIVVVWKLVYGWMKTERKVIICYKTFYSIIILKQIHKHNEQNWEMRNNLDTKYKNYVRKSKETWTAEIKHQKKITKFPPSLDIIIYSQSWVKTFWKYIYHNIIFLFV